MGWQLVFAAPSESKPEDTVRRPSPKPQHPEETSRKPISLKVQLEPKGTGVDEDDDD
jgi:hypothetical protein